MKTKYWKIFIALLMGTTAQGQDINFSQFFELPMLRNPALAGFYRGDIRITSAFRNQWASVTVPYRTQALGAELKFGVTQNSNDYLTLGLQLTNDIAGDSKMGRTQALPVLTYHKSLNTDRDTYLSAGFMGGVVQQRFDPTGLRFDDQFVNGAYSPTNPTRQVINNGNVAYWDAGAGLSFSTVIGYDLRVYVGGAIFHIPQPKVAFFRQNDVRLNRKLVLNGGLSAPTSEYDRVVLYGDVFRQGGNVQGQAGMMYVHDLQQLDEEETLSLSAGVFYRWNDAVVPMLKLGWYHWGFGATYDVNVSRLKTASNMRGGFELTLSYRNFLNIRNSSAQKVRCPVPF